MKLKAPFPAFGGKSRVANLIWSRIGDVDNAIEPFCFSAAWLLARPHPSRIETLNDENCYVANFWRATQHDPETVAEHADWPVNEADLHSRHRWLVLSEAAAEFRKRMRTDPDYYDSKIAGIWTWGACAWIGSGWCSERGAESEQRPHIGQGAGGRNYGTGIHAKGPAPAAGLSQQMPLLTAGYGYGGRGVHQDKVPDSHRPQLADTFSLGRGVHSGGLSQKRPQLSAPENESGHRIHLGRGVHSSVPIQRPVLEGRGLNHDGMPGTCAQRRAWLVDWFSRIRDRLRTVRVCCGDWKRVCDSDSVTTRLGLTGIFLDPPYAKTKVDGSVNRSADLYSNDNSQCVDSLVRDVRAYCLERGPDPRYRICLAGYEGEGHEELEAHGWEVVAWKSSGGYGNRSAIGKENSTRERLWFSPHCLKPGGGIRQGSLFAEEGA